MVDLLIPEVMVETVPGCQLAPGVDEHGCGRRAILGKLLVGIVGADQGQLDRVQWIGHQDLLIESGIDHGSFWTIGTHLEPML